MGILNRFAQLAPAAKDTFEKFTDRILKPVVGKAGNIAGHLIGKAFGLSVDAANNLSKIDWKSIGKAAKDKAGYAGTVGLAGVYGEIENLGNVLNLFRQQLLGDAPISTALFGEDSKITKKLRHTGLFKRDDTSLITGMKATGLGVGLISAGALMANTPRAGREFVSMYRGSNDGMLYTNAPVNTYAQQMAGTQVGHSYAYNAGATGDLLFALHNQRHDGIM